jgi:hypothetical protein
MRDGLLTRYIEAGFPHLKKVSGLPYGLLPDFGKVANTLGDEAMLKVAEPLGLAESLKTMESQAPEPDSLPPDVWQQGIANWPPVKQVFSVTTGLLHACEKADALERRGVLKMNLTLVRGLAVIAYAPFSPRGSGLLNKLADILGVAVEEPARLLDQYMTAVVEDDTDTLAAVDRSIVEDPAWREWSQIFFATGRDFPFRPRAIGISPPLTSGLKQLLANMMIEVINAYDSGNYPN